MALIIGLKEQESMLIGENITVTFIKRVNGSVRLAINAPKEIPVVRLNKTIKKEYPLDRENLIYSVNEGFEDFIETYGDSPRMLLISKNYPELSKFHTIYGIRIQVDTAIDKDTFIFVE